MASESDLLLSGAAMYLDDLRDPRLAGAAHAYFVRSTVAHATFTVELTDARRASGVICAFAAEDNPIWPLFAHSVSNPARFAQPLLAEHKVRFVGEAVAVVVAESREQAVDAAELVIVDYEPLPVVLSADQAVNGDVLLFDADTVARRHAAGPELSGDYSNVMHTHLERGDALAGVGDLTPSDVLVHQQFRNPRQVAAPIECRAATAVWVDGHLHYWASTQTPHGLKNRIALMYDLDPSVVHVIAGPFVGGGFGGKGAPGPEEQFVPYLAQLTQRPVRWVETRSDNLTAAPQGRAEDIEVWLAGTTDGYLTGIKVRLEKDAGAYASSGAGLANHWAALTLTGTYDIAEAIFEQVTYASNRPPVAALRGAGRAPMIHALERAVDMFATEIGMDPAELRRRNVLPATAMPYTAATGVVYDDADYADALDRVLERAGYLELRAEQAQRRSALSSLQLGIGIASYNHRTCGGGGEAALVRIDADGGATVVTGTTSQGHGHERTWRAIASAELGIPTARITVIEGRTDEIATGVGAVGSRSLQTAGLAIHEASQQVVADAISLAADMLEAAPADIVLDRVAGAFHVAGTPSRSLGWAELAAEIEARDEQLSCDHVYNNDGKDVFPSGCHVAVVEVDTETGAWQLIKYVAVDDAGVRVDSNIVDGQLHGGIALGVAQVLGEEMVFDEAGTPLSTSFLDYSIVSIDQLCQFDLEAQVVPSSFNAGGYKAVGESGPIGATPAVHNAVVDALASYGVRHIDIPCTPQRVWNAITDV